MPPVLPPAVPPVRVLVVDDSPLIRRMLLDILAAEGDIEVVGIARDGEEAVRLVAELRPDVVTMDVEMPRLSGLEALAQIVAAPPTPVVMCSTLTGAGAAATLQALEAGAFDFVLKPENGRLSALHALPIGKSHMTSSLARGP